MGQLSDDNTTYSTLMSFNIMLYSTHTPCTKQFLTFFYWKIQYFNTAHAVMITNALKHAMKVHAVYKTQIAPIEWWTNCWEGGKGRGRERLGCVISFT